MNDAGRQHKRAWEYDAYNFWVEHNGTPEVRAKEDAENPERCFGSMLLILTAMKG